MSDNQNVNLDGNLGEDQNSETGGGEQDSQLDVEAIKREKEALEKRLKEREEQIKIKDEALRKKEGKTSEDIEKRLEERMNALLRQKELDMRINALTADEETRKLVRHHIDNTIKSTGDVNKDLELAWAIASQSTIQKLAMEEANAEAFLNVVKQSQIGSGMPSNDMPKSISPSRKLAERIVSAINPEAVKNLRIN